MTDLDSLEAGDFLYQANEEYFLVVIENNEESIDFAVQGWRTIDKDRLENYLDANRPVIHTEEQVERIVKEASDPEGEAKLNWLREIFNSYAEDGTADDSKHEDFALRDQ